MALPKTDTADPLPKSTKFTQFVHLPLVCSANFTVSPFLPSHDLPLEVVPRPAKWFVPVSAAAESTGSLAKKCVPSPDRKSEKKILQCRTPLQGCSGANLPCLSIALSGGNGYEAPDRGAGSSQHPRRAVLERPPKGSGRST